MWMIKRKIGRTPGLELEIALVRGIEKLVKLVLEDGGNHLLNPFFVIHEKVAACNHRPKCWTKKGYKKGNKTNSRPLQV